MYVQTQTHTHTRNEKLVELDIVIVPLVDQT